MNLQKLAGLMILEDCTALTSNDSPSPGSTIQARTDSSCSELRIEDFYLDLLDSKIRFDADLI